MDWLDTLEWLGYPLLLLAVVHAVLGVMLLRRPLHRHAMTGAAAATCWTSSAACLATGIAYVNAANGLDFDIAYRLSWISWLPLVGGIQVLLGTWDSSGRATRIAGWIGYPIAGAIAVLALTTDLVQAGRPHFLPFIDAEGPLSQPIEVGGAVLLTGFLALAGLAWYRIPAEMRQRSARMVLGMAAAAVTSVLFQIANIVVGPIDTNLAMFGTVFWAAGVMAALGPQGLFELDIAAVHIGLVLAWGLAFGLLQLGLWSVLSPPLSGGAALVLSCLLIALLAYAFLPLSRRTLDRLDALVLSGRHQRPVLQRCMRAAVTFLDLDQLLDYLSRTLVREVGIANVSFLLEGEQGCMQPNHIQNNQDATGLPADSALLEWLRREKRPIRASDVQRKNFNGRPDELLHEMNLLHAAVVLPLVCRGRLLGLLALGPMASGATYGRGDISMLSALGDQAAIALENARLFRSATTDDLTGLLQRPYFLTRLKEEMDRSKRHRRAVGLLMLDIDHFKRVNDQFGHAEGDLVLAEVGNRLRRCMRSSDVACRYGGEEFVVMLPETNDEMAESVAQRLREEICQTPISKAGTITVSIGVAEMRPDQLPESLIQHADVAMYQAKRAGRNCVVHWRSKKI